MHGAALLLLQCQKHLLSMSTMIIQAPALDLILDVRTTPLPFISCGALRSCGHLDLCAKPVRLACSGVAGSEYPALRNMPCHTYENCSKAGIPKCMEEMIGTMRHSWCSSLDEQLDP